MALTSIQKEKRNFQYGQIIEGNITYAPYYLMIGDKCYINPKPELYLAYGWKKIFYDEIPEFKADEELLYVLEYIEDETTIYPNWVKIE